MFTFFGYIKKRKERLFPRLIGGRRKKAGPLCGLCSQSHTRNNALGQLCSIPKFAVLYGQRTLERQHRVPAYCIGYCVRGYLSCIGALRLVIYSAVRYRRFPFSWNLALVVKAICPSFFRFSSHSLFLSLPSSFLRLQRAKKLRGYCLTGLLLLSCILFLGLLKVSSLPLDLNGFRPIHVPPSLPRSLFICAYSCSRASCYETPFC